MTEIFDTTRMICEDLKRWGYKVATNQKHARNYPVFHWQGTGGSKPDIFFMDPLYGNEICDAHFIPKNIYHIRAGFIETKSGDHFGELMNGVKQNSRYYKYFLTNKVKCFVGKRQIQNVDVFLLATRWSPTGMLYRGDDEQISQPINYLTERYNMVYPPHTMDLHSFQRDRQKEIREQLRNEKFIIPNNRIKVQAGIMISKIPLHEDQKVSDEYYAWIGRTILPVVAKSKYSTEWIDTQLKFHDEREKALLVETKLRKKGWLPRSVLKFPINLDSIELNKWYRVGISSSFYFKRRDLFGIA